ncbi:MAG TPA: hypothetical protein DCM48_10810, partial [Thalassospira sp.]|nr:hypothetical protein [Thalassospira sp.]
MLFVMSIGGLPALVSSMLREASQRSITVEIIHLLVFLAVVAGLVLRKRLSTFTKSVVIVAAMTSMSLL